MCGIAGFVDRDGHYEGAGAEQSVLLRRMCDAIRHRGPDDEGMFVGDGAALGMRRLSIIDLAGGRQPIRNEDGTVWVVFNGEIYNYRELRAELVACGHAFYTDTDTETIVHAYEQWGEDAFSHLRGMFAFALWDRRTRTLLLARDRVGHQAAPLRANIMAAWLSARKSSRSWRAADAERVIEPGGARSLPVVSVYAGRRHDFPWHPKASPGPSVAVAKTGRLSVRRYWQLPAEESFSRLDRGGDRTLTAVLADAVKSHLVSDVPIGALLSGGVDSSLVVGLMARASSRPIKTFSIGFDEPAFDELDAARRVAQLFATDHHEFVVRPDALGVVDSLVEHFDEPFGDSSAIPTWYVSQMARRHVTVVLSGDGGDELFGGYDRYLPHPARRLVRLAARWSRTERPPARRGRSCRTA